MKKIGFDARLYGETGVGRYIRNLLSQLIKIDSQNEYFVFLKGGNFNKFNTSRNNWHKVKTDLPWHSVKEQIFMPGLLASYRLDLVHFPYFNVPVFYPGKFVLSVHDLIVDHFSTGRSSTLPLPAFLAKKIFYKNIMRQALKRACHIFAISKTTASEVTSHYRVNPEKITVTYDALDPHFRQISKNSKTHQLFPFDYLLYVGNAYPHKNLEFLISVFADSNINSRIRLVLAGDDDFFYPRLKNLAKEKNLSDKIIFIGNASDRKLVNLYRHARALIIPSLMEGFGLPNLEATYLSCPVLASDIPVFREIWQSDLYYFQPDNIASAKKAILKLLAEPKKELEKKINRAKKRSFKFSWEKTARRTLFHYNNC